MENRWRYVGDEQPGPEDWYVAAVRLTQRDFGASEQIITGAAIVKGYPGKPLPERAEVWFRLPPPPWMIRVKEQEPNDD
jgi:hypothetical protein